MSERPTIVSEMAKIYLPQRPHGGVGNGVCNSDTELHASNPAVQAAAEQYFESPDALHGDSMPSQTIVKERPVHRMMIYLHAMGATIKEIADQTGYQYSQVRTVLAQPWARSRLVQILNETGRDQVKHFLSNEVSPSLEVLREVRDNTQARASERISAANSILDRALGKPTVHVETENTNRTVPADAAQLDAQIAAVREQLKQKGADSSASQQN